MEEAVWRASHVARWWDGCCPWLYSAACTRARMSRRREARRTPWPASPWCRPVRRSCGGRSRWSGNWAPSVSMATRRAAVRLRCCCATRTAAGPAPAHMARALLGIQPDALTMSQDARAAGLRDAIYLAAPGQGRRPDFTVVVGDITVRSFERPDPQKTVYLVWSVRCGAGDAGMACSAGTGYKAFHVGADGIAHGVSAQVLPRDPVLTAADLARQEKHGGSDLFLLSNKLLYVATLRWLMECDPDRPLARSDPRRGQLRPLRLRALDRRTRRARRARYPRAVAVRADAVGRGRASAAAGCG